MERGHPPHDEVSEWAPGWSLADDGHRFGNSPSSNPGWNLDSLLLAQFSQTIPGRLRHCAGLARLHVSKPLLPSAHPVGEGVFRSLQDLPPKPHPESMQTRQKVSCHIAAPA